MSTLKAVAPAKIEPFIVNLPRHLSQAEIDHAVSNAVSRSSIPDRTNPQNLSFVIPLARVFKVEADQQGQPQALCTPLPEAIDDEAVRWCQALTQLPPKALPRSQRPIIKLLLRLPPKPTGNTAIDKGRRMILDRMLASLWPALAGALTDALLSAADRRD